MHNGTRLSLNNERSRYNASLSLEPEDLHLTLDIRNFTDSDAGLYIGVVNTRPTTLFSHFDGGGYESNRNHQKIPVGLLPIFVQNIGQIVTVNYYSIHLHNTVDHKIFVIKKFSSTTFSNEN